MSIFRKKTIDDILKERGNKTFNPTMKTLDLILFGIGAIVGGGILVLTGIAASKAGPAVMFSFLIAGIACILAALCYAEMSSAVPSSGSTYAYAYVSIGEFIAHNVGWVLIGGYLLTAATVANGWSRYFISLLSGLGINIPEEFTKLPSAGGYGNIPSLILVIIITFILSKGTTSSKITNNILAAVKIGIVVLFVAVGAFYVEPANLTNNFAPAGINGVMVGATAVFFAYLGFDAISTSAEETINPQKVMPRAIIITLLLCTAFYIVVCLVLTGMVPYTKLGIGNALSFALTEVGQVKAAGLISLGAVIGLMAGVLSFIFAGVRITYTMARDGLLPGSLTATNKHKVPGKLTWGLGILTAIFSSFLPLDQLAELANVAAIISFALVSYATLKLRKTEPNAHRGFRVPAINVVAPLSVVLFVGLLWSVTATTWLILVVWTIVGSVVYFGYSKNNSKLKQ